MSRELPYSLSPSSIAAFKECPLAFRFSYLERLPEPPSAPASKGTLVHKALELLMCRPPHDRTIDAALADLDRARAEFTADPEFSQLELSEEEWAKFHSDADELVRKYFELEDPTKVRPIGLELKLEARVGSARLRGVIDRLDLDDDGELVIIDYKTGGVPSERFEGKSLSGVHIYALLCEQMLGRRPVSVKLYYLQKPEMIIAETSEQKVTGVERRTTALWTAVERACTLDDFRPHRSRLCDWCAFQAYCPEFGGDPAKAVELLEVKEVADTAVEQALPVA
ncbi:MAG: PD-(D/E)XK nuclease family protein [Acidimicrobiia bacterium]|nr:PD-(D/E)XK nuclease family protein [Acidimicrobiia bacterium]